MLALNLPTANALLISKIPQPDGSSAPGAARRQWPQRAAGWEGCRDETAG